MKRRPFAVFFSVLAILGCENKMHGVETQVVLNGSFEEVGDGNEGHGTSCAGIIGAIRDNGIGCAGVAPGVRIFPVNMTEVVDGFPFYDDALVADGIPPVHTRKQVYYNGIFRDFTVYRREELKAGHHLEVPSIIVAKDSTVVVDERFDACVDEYTNIVLTIKGLNHD